MLDHLERNDQAWAEGNLAADPGFSIGVVRQVAYR